MALGKEKPSSRSPSRRASKRGASGNRRPAVTSRHAPPAHPRPFAVCVRNDDYPASLELRKLYRVIDDDFAAQHQLIRVIDESGGDYLYPANYFVRVDLPRAVTQTLRRIA
jgi:hypothetical protein